MGDAAKIAAVEFRPEPLFVGLGPGGPVEVHATFDDGQTTRLFGFYPDELTFTEEDLVGLTAREARDLHYQRDLEWLRS